MGKSPGWVTGRCLRMPQQVAPAKAIAQVVVLGAGAAGIYVARALRGQANVTIVDRSVEGRLLPRIFATSTL